MSGSCRPRLVSSLAAFLLVTGFACAPSPAAQPPGAAVDDPEAGLETPPPKRVPARAPSGVMNWAGAEWLEREDRVELEKPEVTLRAMNLRDGDMVADIGAGTGFFTRRLAKAVGPSGKVYANDVQSGMLDRLKELAGEEGTSNIVTVLGTQDDLGLPAKAFDWVLLVDVYHEFQNPEVMLERIREALKPGGRVALVEYRLEGDTASHIDEDHRMSVEQVTAEWGAGGFTIEQRIEDLPSQHLFILAPR